MVFTLAAQEFCCVFLLPDILVLMNWSSVIFVSVLNIRD